MLADTESEKTKWVVALSELHRILKRNNLPNTAIFRVREVLDSSLSVLRGAQSALIIDPDRILLGTEDGLFCLDLDRSGKLIDNRNTISASRAITVAHYCLAIS